MYRFFLVLVIVVTLPIIIVGFLFNACTFAFTVGSVIRRQAEAADKEVTFEPTDYEGWLDMTVFDRLPYSIRARAKFKVIEGGLAEQAAKGDK